MNEEMFITWPKFEEMMTTLVQQIKRSGKAYYGIYAVSRGGLIPAYYVARALKIVNVQTICIHTYLDGSREKSLSPAELIEMSQMQKAEAADWLVIDDIVDTGDTMRVIQEEFPGIDCGVLIHKRNDVYAPTYAALTTDDQRWVVFPWEHELQA